MPQVIGPSGFAGRLRFNTQGIAIRPAEQADVLFLRQLFFAVKAEDFGGLALPAPMLAMMLDQQFRAQHQGYAQAFSDGESCIIERDGIPVGRMMIARLSTDRVHLVDIALLANARGQGTGTDVLTALIAAVRADGYRQLTLSVAVTNTAASRLYARLGFQFADSDTDWPASRQMALIL